jgi:class 3 adenylate cyclase/ATP/maltotriose-dependent transcriptional regulator MalT
MAICPVCSEENPDRARFCLGCGTPLAAAPPPAAPAEERKLVSAVFVDLVGFTARSELLDPEDVHAVQAPYHARLRAELERHGGTVEKFIGDAVMALFGAPDTHEDDAERAVRAALAIRDGIAELNEARPAFDLHIRIGVNTGEALIALGARPSEGEGMASGDVVNTASRLQSNAPIDGILIGEATQRAVAHLFELKPVAPIQAKGKAEPVHAWEVVGSRDRVLRPALGAPLVGRTRELHELTGLWGSVRRERRVALATVIAPAGVGKSRLLAEVAARLEDEADVHWGRCLAYGEGITYWPVIEIVKDAAGIKSSDEPEIVSAKLGELLECLPTSDTDTLRAIASTLANLLGAPTSPRGTYVTEAITQNELHWGIRSLFELVAQGRPQLLVLEDLHWAEPTLLELLSYVLAGRTAAPVLIIASARPELLESDAEMLRQGSVLELEPLTDRESERLLVHLLGAEAPPDGVAAVLRTAAGNPLFLEETVRMLADRGGFEPGQDADFEHLPVPSSLQSLIGARLDRLDPHEKEVAQRASVVGNVFWSGAVSHLDGDADVEPQLDALERRDVVVRRAHSAVAEEPEWEFRHVLIRDVAYARLPKRRRATLHVRCAEWISALPAAQDLVEIIAYHLEQSCLTAREVGFAEVEPPVTEAIDALTRAAEKAERREGLREAERFYARALALAETGTETALELGLRHGRSLLAIAALQRATDELLATRDASARAGLDAVRCGAIVALANIYGKQGRAADARALLDEAQTLAEAIGDRELQVRTAYELSRAHAWFDGAATQALDELRGAVRLAEELSHRELTIEGHIRIGSMLFNAGQLEQADEHLALCTRLAENLGGRRDEARALTLLALVRYYRGALGEAEELASEAAVLLERLGDRHILLQNARTLAKCALARGEAEEAELRLLEHLETAKELGGWLLVEFHRYLAEALVRQGRIAEAAREAEAARHSLPAEDAYASAAALMAEIVATDSATSPGATQERIAEALRLLQEHNLLLDLEEARIDVARVHHRLGDLASARKELSRAADALERLDARGPLEYLRDELAAAVVDRAGLLEPRPIADS